MNSVPEWVLVGSLYAHRSWGDNTEQQFQLRRLVHHSCCEVIHRLVPLHNLRVLGRHKAACGVVQSCLDCSLKRCGIVGETEKSGIVDKGNCVVDDRLKLWSFLCDCYEGIYGKWEAAYARRSRIGNNKCRQLFLRGFAKLRLRSIIYW